MLGRPWQCSNEPKQNQLRNRLKLLDPRNVLLLNREYLNVEQSHLGPQRVVRLASDKIQQIECHATHRITVMLTKVIEHQKHSSKCLAASYVKLLLFDVQREAIERNYTHNPQNRKTWFLSA